MDSSNRTPPDLSWGCDCHEKAEVVIHPEYKYTYYWKWYCWHKCCWVYQKIPGQA